MSLRSKHHQSKNDVVNKTKVMEKYQKLKDICRDRQSKPQVNEKMKIKANETDACTRESTESLNGKEKIEHVCNDINLFKTIKKISSIYVRLTKSTIVGGR